MPKIQVGDVNLYHRVFRDRNEYRQINEENTVAKYFHDTAGVVTSTDIPLTIIDGYKVRYMNNATDCVDKNVLTLIMLPGGPGFVDHSLYSDFWATLSDVAQVIVVDQRGNGRSDHGNPQKWNLETCADDVKKFSDALGLTIPPIIAGVSWGGYVAMVYAAKHPNHPKALILMHTEAKVSSAARQHAFAQRAREHGLSELDVSEIIQIVHDHDYNPTGDGVKGRYVEKCWGIFYGRNPYQPEDFAKCVTNMPMRTQFLTNENLEFDLYPQLVNIVCPTIFIAGEIDPGHPLSEAAKTAKHIPHANFKVLLGVGAPTYRDDPQTTKEIITEFIESIIQSGRD